jgi:hypothetical protein
MAAPASKCGYRDRLRVTTPDLKFDAHLLPDKIVHFAAARLTNSYKEMPP